MRVLLISLASVGPCVALLKLQKVTSRASMNSTATPFPVCPGDTFSDDCPEQSVGCREDTTGIYGGTKHCFQQGGGWDGSAALCYENHDPMKCETNGDCCEVVDGTAHEFTCMKDFDATGTCTVSEDPHITVFDQTQVSLISTDSGNDESGDMWLVKSSQVEIQARYMPDDELPDQNLFVRAVAVGGSFLNGNTLIVGSLQDHVTWNEVTILAEEESYFEATESSYFVKATRSNKTGSIEDPSKEHQGIKVELPLGVSLILNRQPRHVNVAISMPGQEGQDGLCGNFNGIAADDSLELSSSRLYPKVPPEQSLFQGPFEGPDLSVPNE